MDEREFRVSAQLMCQGMYNGEEQWKGGRGARTIERLEIIKGGG